MNVDTKIYRRGSLLSITEALTLMINFGPLIATLIFEILKVIKEDKKK